MKQKIRKYGVLSIEPYDRSPFTPEFSAKAKHYNIYFDDKEVVFSFLETHSTPIKYSLHELRGKPSYIKLLFDLHPKLVVELENKNNDPEETLRTNGFTKWKE